MRASPAGAKAFEDYYLRQVGNGMAYFQGANRQAGHGLGQVLKSLFRSAIPLVSSGAKVLGKQMLKTGLQVASDVAAGKRLKKSVNTRTREGGTQLLGQINERVRGRSPTKRKQTTKRKNALYAKRKRNTKTVDIFS